MSKSFHLFPEQASTSATRLDGLFLFLVATAAFFTFLIFMLVVGFVLKYRRGRTANRSQPPTFHLGLELGWSLLPLAIMMACFFWGAKLYVDSHQPPSIAVEVNVVGKQWMWKVQHGSGRKEINEIHVPLGQPVRLRMISQDVIHSFYIPAFRTKQDVLPGRYTEMWFEANRVGEYHLFCAEYCGTEHSQMRGRVIVQPVSEYTKWLASAETESPAETGKRLFEQYRCDTCHANGSEASNPKAPSLVDWFQQSDESSQPGKPVHDISYFRKALYQPKADVAAGFEPTMPTYLPKVAPDKSSLSEEQVLQLAAYVRSLTSSAGDGNDSSANPEGE